MPTTFANTISLDGGTTNLPIYADRAEKDSAGNSLQTTYATKSELTTGLSSKQDTISDLATIRSGAAAGATAVQPGDLAAVAVSGAYADLSGTPTINNVPAVTSSDDNKVLKASYSGGTGSYSWQTESGGTVTDVEVDGTSVVSGGVASITMPTELVPTVGSGDNAKVLTAAYDSGTGTGSYSWKVPAGLFIAQYGTSTYDEIDAAASTGKIVYCYVNGRFAFLAYTNTLGSDHNYEFQYYRSASSGKDSVFIYKVRPAGSTYGPEWETTQRDVKAGNISYPVTNVKVNGSSVMSGTVAEITLPTIPVTDVEVDGTSVVNASGVAEITMPTELVPTVTSSDNNKVLKASYSEGAGSYSWQPESGGGGGGDGADWAAEQGEPGYIENKPVPKTLTGGTGISITESPSTITVSCNVTAPVQDVTVDGTSVVSNGVAAITSPTVDQTYDASSANAQSGVAVAEGISDAIGDLPTNLTSAQIQSFKEALGCDETVLWEGTLSPSFGPNCNVTFQVSESILNFERIEVFCNGSISYLTWHPVSGKTGTPVAYQGLNENTSNDVVIGGVIIVDNNTTLRYRCGYGSSFTTSYRGEYWGYGTPYKVVGVHRIASN